MSADTDSRGIGPGQSTLSDGQIARANWVTLSVFEVTCQNRDKVNAPVYLNGLQQVPIRVRIEARDGNGIPVSLTEQQLREIKLFEYDNPGREFLGMLTPGMFLYNHTVSPAGESAEDKSDEEADVDSIQSITRYLAFREIQALKLAATITSPLGVVYRTNVANPNPAMGEFDSWVNVVGVEPVRFGASDMEVVHHNQMDAPDVDLYFVKFRDNRFYIMDDAYYADYLSDGGRGDERNSGQVNFCALNHSGNWYTQFFYLLGDQKQVTYRFWGIPFSFPVNQKEGQSTFARITTPLTPVEGVTQEFHRAQRVVYYNQHGNSALVQMRPVDGGNRMELEDARGD